MVRVYDELSDSVEALKQLHREGYTAEVVEGVKRLAHCIKTGNSFMAQQAQLNRIEWAIGTLRSSSNVNLEQNTLASDPAVAPRSAATAANAQTETIRRAIAAMNAAG